MGNTPAGNDDGFDERLKRASHKLNPHAGEFAVTSTDEGKDDGSMSSFGLAIRVGTDLVAGLAVGVAIGFGLGHWLGHKALFLSVFALAGFGAGMLNVWRILKDSDMVSGPKDDGEAKVATGSTIDALGQFELHPVLGSLGEALRFSQSPLFMLIAVVLVLTFLYLGMRPAAVVPGRLQAAAEISYDFVRDLAVSTIGEDGAVFFPFVFAIFFFILAGNYLGLLPFSFTYTSHIAVTLGLAVMVFLISILASIRFQGVGFLKHFLPAGTPVWLAPLLVPIEIISFLSRPVSLSIRLFANMVAGHVLLEVFAGFTIMLAGLGAFGHILAIAPIAINIALTALELLVGVLQAYVFAILTCIYLREAVAH